MLVSVAAWSLVVVGAMGLKHQVVLGLNKYSHNACACMASVETGKLMVCLEKERLTRRKNDGGSVGDLVRHLLFACDLDLDDVVMCAANDHHASPSRTEALCRARSSMGIGLDDEITQQQQQDVLDPYNLVSPCFEVSHHMAHAFGAAASESSGGDCAVLVMDGMGERASRFRRSSDDDVTFRCDAELDGWSECEHVLGDKKVSGFDQVPSGARECESLYAYKNGKLSPIWKRWASSPYEDFDAWFLSPLDSFGAAYSAVSHVISGDWNACGKVMGLAPWGSPERDDRGWGRQASWIEVDVPEIADDKIPRIIDPVQDASTAPVFRVNRDAIFQLLAEVAAELPEPYASALSRATPLGFPPSQLRSNLWNAFEDDAAARDACRACCAALARIVQDQLETAAIPVALKAVGCVESCDTLVLCGGVALNSVLNGKIETALRASKIAVKVPPCPGDEGVALGCVALALAEATKEKVLLDTSILPFAGPRPPEHEVEDALATFEEWLVEVGVEDEIEASAEALCSGSVLFWYEGESEFGPRALGHRSILAAADDPRVVDLVNAVVKGREDFRPLAPSVLEDCAPDIFLDATSSSPYMSRVWQAKDPDSIAACAHVDGSSRPQTVSGYSRYARLIRAVEKRSGLPLVLDTSFNTKPREPIVESPAGAISSFLYVARKASSIDLVLVFPGRLFRPRNEPRWELSPRRRHETYSFEGDLRIRVYDLDEMYEDAEATRRGDFVFLDSLEAAIYEQVDGEASSRDLASSLVDGGLAEDEDEAYRRIERLWRATLLTFS